MWTAQQMGVALLNAAYVKNLDSHLRYSDVQTNEIAAGGGYVTGGAQILNRTTSYDPAADEFNLLGDDLTWGPGATITASFGVIYEMTSANKWLWALLDFGQSVAVSNGVFTIDWTAGLLSVQSAGPA
jgi:hypothetical protein